MTNWNNLKKNISSLSQTDWDEIDLTVNIASSISDTKQTIEIIQTENDYLNNQTNPITK